MAVIVVRLEVTTGTTAVVLRVRERVTKGNLALVGKRRVLGPSVVGGGFTSMQAADTKLTRGKDLNFLRSEDVPKHSSGPRVKNEFAACEANRSVVTGRYCLSVK